MFSKEDIKAALINGNKRGFKLFPEAHDKSIMDKLGNLPQAKVAIASIKAYTNSIFGQDSAKISFSMFKEFEKTGNRLIFENAYFERRKQLFSLVISYILEQDKKYIPAIEQKLWEWCDLYSWELPAHYTMTRSNIHEEKAEPDKTVALFSAETGFFFSEILSVIGGELDEFLVDRLKKEICRRVIEPYKGSCYWWETAKMNWSSVCAGSVGVAALYLIEDVEELSLILERVLKSMEAFIEAFDKDGLITEGLAYWSYGFSFYVYFAELLSERTAGEISLLHKSEKIKKIAQLPQILQFPSGDFVNFSDSGSGKWWGDSGLFSKLQKTLNVEGYNYTNGFDVYSDHTFRWAIMSRKLFWSGILEQSNNNQINTGSTYFSESQWLVDRREVNGNFVAFAAKGGNNDEPHNHNDLGHFILHYIGEDLFVDIGSPEYLKEYFRDETRYDFLAASSVGHSVPLINNCAQNYGKEHYAECVEYKELDARIHFVLDLKNAYSCVNLIQYKRKFIWDYKALELEINDVFEFDKAGNEIKEVFITKVKPECVEDGKLEIHMGYSTVEILFERGLECIIEECTYNNHSGLKSVIYRTMFVEKVNESKNCMFKIKLEKLK
jgi:hypothetical protein